MRIFTWLALLLAVIVTIFVIQNSTTPLLTMKFLIWEWQTSLLYVMLASLVVGMLIMLLMWVPFAYRSIFQRKDLKKEIEFLRRNLGANAKTARPGEGSEERPSAGNAPSHEDIA